MRYRLLNCSHFAGAFRAGGGADGEEELSPPAGAPRNGGGADGPARFVHRGAKGVVACRLFDPPGNVSYLDGVGGGCYLAVPDAEGNRFPPSSASVEAADPPSLFRGMNGSWAMALLDGEGLFLARDDAGVQSVYHMRRGDTVHFSSSLRDLRRIDGAIDRGSVAAFLFFLYVPPPETILEKARAVPHGEYVHFAGGAPRGEAYRDESEEDRPAAGWGERLAPEQAERAYEGLLADGMARACGRSGGNALLLSGGKDSSVLAIGAKIAGLKNVAAVTVGFDDPRVDETADGRRVADHLGMPFHSLKFPAERYFADWPRFVARMDQPMGDPAALPLHCAMADLAGSEFATFFDGSGCDRNFGYVPDRNDEIVWRINRLAPWLHRLPWNLLDRFPQPRLARFAARRSRPPEEQFVSWLGWRARELESLLGGEVDVRPARLADYYRRSATASEMKTRMLADLWEPGAVYRKSVQAAALGDRQMRFPFLDRKLSRFTAALPRDLRLKGTMNKVLLRGILRKHLPAGIASKGKGFFDFPKWALLRFDDHRLIREHLSRDALAAAGLVDEEIALAAVEKYRRGDAATEDRVWALLVLHAWLNDGSEGR